MDKRDFLNRLKGLSFIDHDRLPELSINQWTLFSASPVDYFILANDAVADAIWREVEKDMQR